MYALLGGRRDTKLCTHFEVGETARMSETLSHERVGKLIQLVTIKINLFFTLDYVF